LSGRDGVPGGLAYSIPEAHTITEIAIQSQNATKDLKINLSIGDKRSSFFGSGLEFALAADLTMTLGSPTSGDAISDWLNAINPSESASQSTSDDQPMWSSSNYVHFASGFPGDHFDLPATPFSFDEDEEFTIFIVTGMVTANSDNESFILGGTNTGGSDYRSCYGIYNSRRALIDNDENDFISTSHIPSGSQIRCISRRSSGNMDEYVDGTQTLTDDNTCDKEFKFTYINNALTRSGQSSGTLRLFEVLVYSDSISSMGSEEDVFGNTTTVREQIEGYLAHKWSLTGGLDSTHPYKSSDPRGTGYDTFVMASDLSLSSGKNKYNPSSEPSFSNGGGTSPSDWDTASLSESVDAGEVVRIFPTNFQDVGELLVKVTYT
tara:strand:- start:3063 stop:4196 length:1134 start_codon:yes stop_codon:yes gene_type:complete